MLSLNDCINKERLLLKKKAEQINSIRVLNVFTRLRIYQQHAVEECFPKDFEKNLNRRFTVIFSFCTINRNDFIS